MAATVQLDPYHRLSRKIGYSVGLENLHRNANELTELYVKERSVSFANWSGLVRDKFHRKERAALEIANFFSNLNLIRIMGRELHVLHGLDNLSILRRYFENDDKAYNEAAQVLLAHAILEADGDVFLCCLAAQFEQFESGRLLELMVRWKWEHLTGVIKNPGLQKQIWDVVSIKSQPTAGHKHVSPTDAAIGKRNPAFEPRKGPSPFEPRRQPYGELPTKEFKVADSYLQKVLPTRKGWARDLLLFDDNGLTERGRALLSALLTIGIGEVNATYFFWPYESDLAKLRIQPKQLNTTPLSEWDLLRVLANSFGGVGISEFDPQNDYDNVIEELRSFHTLYKSGSVDRGRIRHQLPLFMAKPLLVAIAVAKKMDVPPLPQIIDKEGRLQHRRLTVTNVRGTDGALMFSD